MEREQVKDMLDDLVGKPVIIEERARSEKSKCARYGGVLWGILEGYDISHLRLEPAMVIEDEFSSHHLYDTLVAVHTQPLKPEMSILNQYWRMRWGGMWVMPAGGKPWGPTFRDFRQQYIISRSEVIRMDSIYLSDEIIISGVGRDNFQEILSLSNFFITLE